MKKSCISSRQRGILDLTLWRCCLWNLAAWALACFDSFWWKGTMLVGGIFSSRPLCGSFLIKQEGNTTILDQLCLTKHPPTKKAPKIIKKADHIKDGSLLSYLCSICWLLDFFFLEHAGELLAVRYSLDFLVFTK